MCPLLRGILVVHGICNICYSSLSGHGRGPKRQHPLCWQGSLGSNSPSNYRMKKKSGRYCFVTQRWLSILSFCTLFVKWVQLLYLHLFVLFVGDMIPNIVLSYFVELIYLGWIDLADSITRIDGLNDMRPVSSNCLRKKKSGGHLDHERSTEDSSHFSGWE